jgi:tetratricopeptide (TPR) repeat protein
MTKRRRKSSRTSPPLPPPSGGYNQSLIVYAIESGRFSKEVERSKREFWGASIPRVTLGQLFDPGMIFWVDWFIYRRPLKSGLTPLQAFIAAYRRQLSPEDEAAYRKLEESVFGLFKVVEVRRNRSVTVRDLCDGQVYEVAEKRATRQIKAGIVICAHILPLPDVYRFTGALAPWPSGLEEYILGYVERLAAQGSGPGSVGYVPALERARRSVHLEDSNPRRLERVVTLYRSGRGGWGRALELLRPMAEAEPFNPVVNFYYGLLVRNDPAKMEQLLRLTQAVDPDFTGPWGESVDSHLTFALEAQHNYDEAIETYWRMIRRDADDPSNYLNLGRLLTRLGRVDEAEDVYRQECRRFRHDHSGHYCLGTIYQRQGRLDEAREEYVAALQRAYWQLKRWPDCIDEEIVSEMEDALRSVGGDPARVPPYKRRLW